MMVASVSLWQVFSLFTCKEKAVPGLKRVLKKSWPLLAVLIVTTINFTVKEWGSPQDQTNLQKLRIALLQGNIPQDEKWLREKEENIVATYRELTLKANELGVDLVVWPEASAPRLNQESITHIPDYLQLPPSLSSRLLIGTVNGKGTGENLRLYNSAYYFSGQGELLGKYHKTHLVPFGEYVPLEEWIPFKKLVAQSGRFTTDHQFTPMEIAGTRFGMLLCYESIFPDITRTFVKNQAEFMINITNDAWFGNTSALYQHLSMNAFRAAEHGIPIVRAANTGISAVIDRRGLIQTQSPVFVEDMVVAEIEVDSNLSPSFYARTGDLFAFINCLFSLALIEFSRRKIRKKKNEKSGV
jgi:apolipoprotein N-acyltransferase